jgi:putative toxin-antitoxin system antitoxin component (TIGR02293 family)
MAGSTHVSRKGVGRTTGKGQGRFRATPPMVAVHSAGEAGRVALREVLGIPVSTISNLIVAVRKGFPYESIQRLQRAYKLSPDEVGTLVQIPARTLTRRKVSGRLKADESDRVLRAARLMQQATALFNNNPAAARMWMTTPQPSLGGETPLALASTEIGAREVEDALGRIEDGVFA